ncbi:nucleotide exchange factor GrpE [Candidatus Dojkabacteria bacterium]|nr:nucleotide exchange factor GrpE [Candidatus Dojkabacteria bacterium]
MIDKNQLIKLIEASKKVVGTCKLSEVSLDSANFQTRSKEDFEKYVENFESETLKYLLELDHAGRRIRVFDVIDENFDLNFVELTEPKPSSELTKNEWEYVTYVADDYDQCLEIAQDSDYKVEKIREINGTRYFYIVAENVIVQIRNRSVGEIEPIETVADEVAGDIVEDGDVVKGEAINTDPDPDQYSDNKADTPDFKVKYERLMADFENYRRIQEQQAAGNALKSKMSILTDLIEVLDDFQRALGVSNGDGGTEGFGAIYDKLGVVLRENGVEEIDVEVGDEFDAAKMEAVTTIPTNDETQDNQVQEVLRKGYVHIETENVVRTPKVVVAKLDK